MAKKKAEATNGPEKVNKMELVRQSLATLGNDTSPMDIAKHLKDQFKVEISVGTATTYKSSILKKLGQSPRRKRRRRDRPAAEETATGSKPSGDAVSMKDLRMLHDMAQRVGMSRLRELLELVH